jgi:hypothetical protein
VRGVAEETPKGNDLEQEESRFQPGELVAVDATSSEVDVPDDKVEILKGIARRVSQRDLTSRRLEVRDAWKARYFYRGNQHLLPWRGGWTLPPTSIVGDQNFNDHGQETNIYLAAGDILTASLTAGLPSVRFEPGDPNNPADNNAAENADKARLIIERDNDMIVVQEDIARYLFTDGRAVIYTRHILDAQRFGYYNPEPEIQEEESYLPETGGEGPDKPQQEAQGQQPEGERPPEEPPAPNRGEPRGQEVIKVFGVLEAKLPIQANDLHCSDFAQISYEQDITKAKAKYPDVADEIAPVQAPTAESDYERLARTSIMMGMRPNSMTSDSMTYNTTEQLTWVRPSFFSDTDISKDNRQWLYDNFPDGLMMVINGNAFCEARNEGMDDHLTLIHARPGDGMHRPAMGSPAIPIQEKVNDCVDLMHEQCMHQIPNTWVGTEIDLQAMGDLQSKPKQYLKAPKLTGKATADLFYTEPQIELATGFMQYLQWLFGDCLQFLLGIYPALFGGNTGSNDTASGIASQRDQALGRIGLTWRNMKAGYADIIRQAVMAAAEYRKEKIAGTVPGKDGKTMQIAIDPQDLKGNVRCFPDTDENFPESWVAKRAVWQQIIDMAAKNPVLAQILNTPRNLRMAKDKVGVPELVIPGSDSSEKQLGEIMLLLNSTAVPNPQIADIQNQAQQTAEAAMVSGQPIDPMAAQAATQQVQQQIQQLPPEVSSIPVGELDDHAMEAAEIKTWASTAEGIKAQSENQDGFKNVLLHYHEHIAALGPQQPAPAGKPPSDSLTINFKDLPIDGQVQAASKVGITLDAAKMQAEEQQQQAQELAAKAQQKPPMIQ